MEIRSKQQFFELWEAGVLGNRTRLWRSPLEAFDARLSRYGFREVRRQGTAGAGKWELVYRSQFWWKVKEWAAEGRTLIIDDACPNELTTLCGEVIRGIRGMEGTIAIEPRCGMRQAVLVPRSPLVTKLLLERYMDASSRDDLDVLLDLYPDAAVEFSCFPRNVGVIPNRNTIFWEVRNYIWFITLIGTTFLS